MRCHPASTRNSKLETRNFFPNGFTLLEIIVVLGVLAIVLASIFPVVRSTRTATLQKRAKAEATVLAQAAIRYKAEYGFWPGEMVYKDETSVKINDAMPIPCLLIAAGPERFTSRIRGENGGPVQFLALNTNEVFQAFSVVRYLDAGGKYKPNPLNPKRIPFLELKHEEDFRFVNFPDPWGEPYRLIMGLNPRSRFTFYVTRNETPVYEVSVSNVTAFAFSLGPYGNNSTNYIYSAGVIGP